MVGTWEGTMNCLWWGQTRVRLRFSAEGLYTSSSLSGASAFFWDVDGGGYERQYELRDVSENGDGIGRLRIIGRNAAQWGELRGVNVSDGDERLQFEFWGTWGERELGPLTYDLRRLP